ncbi:MAG: DUF6596 domain-containing protein, partial [Pseudomonadota bacterium]
MTEAEARAEDVARASYGKLLAILAAGSSDIARAEDALADAFRAALEVWPERGIPDNPEAWLLTTSRNRLKDGYRSAAHRTTAQMEEDFDMAAPAPVSREEIRDPRLKLMFVCAHPAINDAVRAPLMLQTVLGLEAEQIAPAFLLPRVALAQRLVRAKRKIKEARIPFVLPDQADMADRLEAVLEAIYGTYALDWNGEVSATAPEDLRREALFLADLLVEMLPDEPEVLGLAALLSFVDGRRAARTGGDGRFKPLERQDVRLWDRMRTVRARALLVRA